MHLRLQTCILLTNVALYFSNVVSRFTIKPSYHISKMYFNKILLFFDNFLLTNQNIHDTIYSTTQKGCDFMEKNIYKNSVVHYITKYMIEIMMYCGIICIAALPFSRPFISTYLYRTGNVQTSFMAVLMLSGACSVYILFILKKMFKTLLSGNPFVWENVKCFRRIAVACAVISLIYIINCILDFTFGCAIIALVFAIGCLFCLTLKDIFKQAVAFKEENDLTI